MRSIGTGVECSAPTSAAQVGSQLTNATSMEISPTQNTGSLSRNPRRLPKQARF